MAIVLVNGDVTGVVHPVKTWGELLDILDTQRAVSEDVVTGVRLNGVDIPAFRSPEILTQELSSDAEIYIETARPADLIQETLDEADAAVGTIIQAALCIGGSFRGKDIEGANQALTEFGESLGSLIVVTSAVAEGAGVEMSTLGDGRISANQMICNLIGHAEALLIAQKANDWSRVADIIEYDIAGTIRRWPIVLKGIRHAAPLQVKTAA